MRTNNKEKIYTPSPGKSFKATLWVIGISLLTGILVAGFDWLVIFITEIITKLRGFHYSYNPYCLSVYCFGIQPQRMNTNPSFSLYTE